jgi:hypothetical protein
MALVKRKHLMLYKKYTESIIDDLGKTISVYTKDTNIRCNNCKYDEIHQCSSGEYNGTGPKSFSGPVCPVCSAKGTIETLVSRNIVATCRWVSPSSTEEDFRKSKLGKEELSLLKVKSKVEYYDNFKNADYFIFEEERFRLKNIITRGMKEDVVCIAYLERENV